MRSSHDSLFVDAMNAISLFFNILSSTVVYALFALAIVFAYRTSRVLLFCIGEIGMTSAYVFLQVWSWGEARGLGSDLGFSFVLGIVAAMVAAGAMGGLLYLVLGKIGTDDPFIGTVITIAFSIVFFGAMTTIWRGEITRLPLPDFSVSVFDTGISVLLLGIVTVGAALVATLLLVFYRSTLGIEMQALASNRTLAELRGIPVQRRLATVWITSAVIAGVAGIFSAALSAVSVEGVSAGFSGIVAAIIGGLTSPFGGIIGALLLATGENITNLFFDARYSIVAPVILLALLLIVRPSGLSARVEHIART